MTAPTLNHLGFQRGFVKAADLYDWLSDTAAANFTDYHDPALAAKIDNLLATTSTSGVLSRIRTDPRLTREQKRTLGDAVVGADETPTYDYGRSNVGNLLGGATGLGLGALALNTSLLRDLPTAAKLLLGGGAAALGGRIGGAAGQWLGGGISVAPSAAYDPQRLI